LPIAVVKTSIAAFRSNFSTVISGDIREAFPSGPPAHANCSASLLAAVKLW
jgi:hypothetical protein